MASDLLSTAAKNILLPLQSTPLHPWVPFPLLSFLHALRISLEYRRSLHRHGGTTSLSSIRFLQGLVAVSIMSLGGTTMASVLLGIPPPWLTSNVILPTYATAFVLLFYSPGDIIYTALETFCAYGGEPVLVVADGIARAMAQCMAGVEAVRSHPLLGQEKYLAQLIIGTLAGTGGGLMADAFVLSSPVWMFRLPMALQVPTIDLKSGLAVSWVYMMLTDPVWMSMWMGYVGGESEKAVQVMGKDEARVVCAVIFATGLLYKSYGGMLGPLWTKKAVDTKEKKVESETGISDKKE